MFVIVFIILNWRMSTYWIEGRSQFGASAFNDMLNECLEYVICPEIKLFSV